MKRIFLILIIACFGASAQNAKMNLSLKQKLDDTRNSERVISLLVKGNVNIIRQQVEQLGGVFKYAAGDIAAVNLPLSKIRQLSSVSEIKRIESSSPNPSCTSIT